MNEEIIEKAVVLEQERISVLSELPGLLNLSLNFDYKADLLIWEKSSSEEVKKFCQPLRIYEHNKCSRLKKEKLKQKDRWD